MKAISRKFVNILCTILVCTVSMVYSQITEDDWACGFEDAPEKEQLLQSLTLMQDTTLKVGLLLVQFSDWQNSLDSRGSVGWGDKDNLNLVDTTKYKYEDYWNIFFSFGTYRDIDPEHDPHLHPDAQSHGIGVWGSFTDYWWEVSHGNLRIQPALTHPTHPWGNMYQTGLINRVNTTDSAVVWITLDHPKFFYTIKKKPNKLLNHLWKGLASTNTSLLPKQLFVTGSQ
ncbi:MAG: hypothetical protein D6732_25315 [Methanobacteriota archaeon]|nr:MAG: hypothetical protein D6732_25315 [Euryarchaeota archaeon]